MYAVTSMPPEMRTRATLRSAEFGFLGVVVYTRVQTPRRWGAATFFFPPLPDFRPGRASFWCFGCVPFGARGGAVAMRGASEKWAPLRPPRRWPDAAPPRAWTP